MRRLVAVLAAAFSHPRQLSPINDLRRSHDTDTFGSLVAGGLNWESLPLKLFAGGNAKFWDPADIDFSRDRADWERLTDDERDYATRLCAEFIAGEEAVTEDIQPFMAAMRAEGRLGDEMYLTQFAFEEAKHVQVFRMWLDAVGVTDDLHGYLDDSPAYREMFYDELPDCLGALVDRSVAGRPGPGLGDLQPHRRGHAGADRLLRLAQDLRGPRHPARHAGAGSAHRRRRAAAHGVGHLHLPAPRRRRRRQLGGVRNADERAPPVGAAASPRKASPSTTQCRSA